MTAFWITLALKATVWAVFMSVAAWAVPVHRPQWRRRVALLGMWGLWLLPWLPLPAAGLPAASIPAASGISYQPGFGWLILLSVWVSGSLILLLRMMKDVAAILRLVRHARQSASHPGALVEVRYTSEVAGPCMTGWLRPCVLLPSSAATWPEAALHAALRHEFQHARQRDGLHRLCAALVRAIFWWNPAMHALCGIYEAESEVCCDEAAATTCSRREYGEMLLAHATQASLPAFAMSFARRSSLRARMQRLFTPRQNSPWLLSVRWLAAALLILCASVLMTSIRAAPSGLAQKDSLREEAITRLNADPFPEIPEPP